MTSIYLIRHATPDWSRTDVAYDVPPGPPLTAQGEAEATKLNEFVAGLNIARVYASPLERTRRTAELAFAGLDVAILSEAAIAEWRRGEPEQEVAERMVRFFEQIAAESHDSMAYAVVSHGGPIRILLQHLGMSKDEVDFYRRQFDRDNPVPPAGVWKASRRADGMGWELELVYTPQPHQSYVPATVYV